MRLAGILVVPRNQGQASSLAAGQTASPHCVHVLCCAGECLGWDCKLRGRLRGFPNRQAWRCCGGVV